MISISTEWHGPFGCLEHPRRCVLRGCTWNHELRKCFVVHSDGRIPCSYDRQISKIGYFRTDHIALHGVAGQRSISDTVKLPPYGL